MIKLFKEVYLSQFHLEDTTAQRLVFRKDCDEFPVFTKDLDENFSYILTDSDGGIHEYYCVPLPGLIAKESSFKECFENFFDFINFLNEIEGKITIYADKESYMDIISSWLKVIFPDANHKEAYEYVYCAILSDVLITESYKLEDSFKVNCFQITPEEWEASNKRNYFGIQEHEIDLVKFWKYKNVKNLDFPVVLCNYLYDGSFKKELREILINMIENRVEDIIHEDCIESALDLITSGVNPSSLNRSEYDIKQRMASENKGVEVAKLKDFYSILEKLKTNDPLVIDDLIKEKHDFLSGKYHIDNAAFTKHVFNKMHDKEFLRNFKL